MKTLYMLECIHHTSAGDKFPLAYTPLSTAAVTFPAISTVIRLEKIHDDRQKVVVDVIVSQRPTHNRQTLLPRRCCCYHCWHRRRQRRRCCSSPNDWTVPDLCTSCGCLPKCRECLDSLAAPGQPTSPTVGEQRNR